MYIFRFFLFSFFIISVNFSWGEGTNEQITEDTISTLFEKTAIAMERGLYKEAISAYAEVIEKSQYAKGDLISAYQCASLANIGVCYQKLNQDNDALKNYEEVISKYKNTNDPSIFEPLCLAYLNAGIIHMDKHQYDIAETYFKTIIDLSLKRKNIRYFSAKSMKNLGVLYKRMDLDEKYMEICNAILDEFKNDEDDKIAVVLIEATIDKMSIHIRSGKWNDAKQAFYDFKKINKSHSSKEYEFSLMKLNSVMANIAYEESEWDMFFDLLNTYGQYRERIKSPDLDTLYTPVLYRAAIKLLSESKPKEAEKAYKTMEKIFFDTEGTSNRMLVYISLYNLAILYYIEGNKIEGDSYAKKAEEF